MSQEAKVLLYVSGILGNSLSKNCIHNVSNSIPGKTIIAADFTLSRLLSLNLLKTEVAINPKAGIRRIYNITINNMFSTIKK